MSRAENMPVRDSGAVPGASALALAPATASATPDAHTPDTLGTPEPASATSDARTPGTPASQPLLEVRNLSCGYGKLAVLEGVSLSLRPASTLSLLGPNGVGKTTLFKTILGFMPRMAGEVFLEGREMGSWDRKEYARAVAYVPQAHETAFAFSVHDLVLMGRTPALSALATPGAQDERICCEVLQEMGLAHLAQRSCTELSGGELQMALIARALVQMPRLLVMDEPCANLDLGNQTRVLEKMAQLSCEGLSILVCTHDPNHALFLGGSALCLGRGGEVRQGPAREILTPETLSWLYGTPIGTGTVADAAGREAQACAPVRAARAEREGKR